MRPNEKTVSIPNVRCMKIASSGKAVLIKTGAGECWVPTNCISSESQVSRPGDGGTLTISRWLLGQEGKEALSASANGNGPDNPANYPSSTPPPSSGSIAKVELIAALTKIETEIARLRERIGEGR